MNKLISMKKIYITGISGTGKTAIAKSLEKKCVHCISIDEAPGLCHWRHKTTKQIVNYKVKLNKEFIDAHEYRQSSCCHWHCI